MICGEYKTLASSSCDELTVQKSRFIGYAAPVSSQEEALDYIKQVKDKHRDASHHCYAYIIGQNAGIMRYQDDGEPSGTAGQPIMEVLKQRELVDCCCVVVRYFGGVLLGTGGLARAYSKGCAIAVEAAGLALMEQSARLILSVPYSLWDKIQHRLAGLPQCTEDTRYSDRVTARLIVRLKDKEAVEKAIAECSDGRADLICGEDTFYYAWPSA